MMIRKASVEDAKDIVYVNTYTWLSTYKNLMADEILKKRLESIDERVKITKEKIKNNNYYVAIVDNKIVGFISYGKSRNNNYPDIGEIYSIYVLKEYQGIGIGKELFLKGMTELINKGYNDMILNVLVGNNAIYFYKKFGGKEVDVIKDKFYGYEIEKIVMYFKDIKNNLF